MKRLNVIIVLLGVYIGCFAQNDLILLRNGMEYQGQISVVSQEKTVFKDVDNQQAELRNADIYMIKYDKRRNEFFTETGEHFSGEVINKVPNDVTAIYLIEGKEIFAYDVSISIANQSVTYYPPSDKKGLIYKKRKGTSPQSIPLNKVFLIKYADGAKDLINDLDAQRKQKEEEKRKKEADERKKKAFPKSATIITKKEAVINALVLSNDGNVVEFKRVSMTNSPVFIMSISDIQDIFYKEQ